MATTSKNGTRTTKTDDDFTYKTSAGQLRLPKMSHIKFGTMRRLRKLDETEQMFQLVEEVCGEAELAILDELSQAEIGTVMEAWAAASGVELGESSASSTSSSDTARPSNTT